MPFAVPAFLRKCGGSDFVTASLGGAVGEGVSNSICSNELAHNGKDLISDALTVGVVALEETEPEATGAGEFLAVSGNEPSESSPNMTRAGRGAVSSGRYDLNSCGGHCPLAK
jgi:hypothetical protein